MFGDNIWLSLLWVVVCVVLVIGLAYWFTRYVASRGGLGGFGVPMSGRTLEVLEQISVGKDQRLAVIRAGERYFLVGIAPSHISTLAEFSADEAARWAAERREEADKQTPSFVEALQTVLKQKGRR